MEHRCKRFLSILLTLVMFIGVLPGMTAFAATWTSGATTVTYDTSAKTLTVSGSGAIADYTNEVGSRAPWYANRHTIESVVIEEGVTRIGNYAFYSLMNGAVKNITIPDSVTSIGEGAFKSCNRVTSVTIGSGVTSIGKQAFQGCTKVTSFTFEPGAPGSSLVIDKDAFLDTDDDAKVEGLYQEDGVTPIAKISELYTFLNNGGTPVRKSTGFTVTY